MIIKKLLKPVEKWLGFTKVLFVEKTLRYLHLEKVYKGYLL